MDVRTSTVFWPSWPLGGVTGFGPLMRNLFLGDTSIGRFCRAPAERQLLISARTYFTSSLHSFGNDFLFFTRSINFLVNAQISADDKTQRYPWTLKFVKWFFPFKKKKSAIVFACGCFIRWNNGIGPLDLSLFAWLFRLFRLRFNYHSATIYVAQLFSCADM